MKKSQKIKNQARERRHQRVRAKVFGTAKKPRLSVYKSLAHIYVQLIDDQKGKTLLSASDQKIKGKNKTDRAKALGQLIAQEALAKKISQVVFDRGRFKYHGRVQAVAEGAKEAGLRI